MTLVSSLAEEPRSIELGAAQDERSLLERARAFSFRDLRSTSAVAGSVVLFLLVVVGPVLWPLAPSATTSDVLVPPSWSHPMGTDDVGRDLLSRVIAGARISCLAAVTVAAVSGLIGGAAGVIAGVSTRRVVDDGITRVSDSFLAVPMIILAMAVSIGLGPGVGSAIIGITISVIPFTTRLVRAEVRRIRKLPHVQAAEVLGATRFHVIRHHIVPYALPTLLVNSASVFGHAILALAGLSFVGLGAQPPTPEWGALIVAGQRDLLSDQWWTSVFPGLAVVLVVVIANTLASRTQVFLDPRTGPRR